MATFEVDVQGATYQVDAPDEATAWKWAVATHQQSQPTAPAAAQGVPVESGTMLAAPMEGGGQPAPEMQGPPAPPEAMAQPGLPAQGFPVPPAMEQPQQMSPVEQAPSVDSLNTVQRAFAGDASAIADVALGSAMAGQEREQNLAAAALRGAAPTAVGAGAGALIGGGLGSLAGGVGAIPGAIIGARVGPMALEGADLLTAGVNQMFKTNFTTPSEAVQHLLTQYGVQESVTSAEQLTEAAAKGAAGTLGGVGLGKQLATSAAPMVSKVGQFLAATPVGQTIAGATGALASETARQEGVGAGGQLAAGLAGAIVPGALVSGARAVGSAVKQTFTPSDQIAKALRQASGRMPKLNSNAAIAIAEAGAADPEILQAARALGLDVDNMSPAILSKNRQFQSIAMGVQSARGSQTGLRFADDLKRIQERAAQLGEEWGAQELGELNKKIRDSMTAVVKNLEAKAEDVYSELARLIPAETPVPEGSAVAAVKETLKKLNGDASKLTSLERDILALAEKPVASAALEDARREASFLAARNGTTVEEELAKMSLPTSAKRQASYFEIDRLRKKVGAKTKGESVFSDATRGEAKNYYKLLTADQEAAADLLGHKELVQQAKSLVFERKNLEDQMVKLFGEQLDRSFVSRALRPSLSAISRKDTDQLVNMINTVPKEFREEVIVSGLVSMFSRANTDGAFNPKLFSNFMSAIESSPIAKNAIFSNLPAETVTGIRNLAKVSQNLTQALGEKIGTGALAEALKTSDSLLKKVLVHVAGYAGGLKGLFAVHLLNGKSAPLQAADEFLSSPQFLELVKTSVANPDKFAPAARRATSSPAFIKFAEAANIPAAARSTFFAEEQPQQESQ
jgi:hypothetical protein